MNDNFLNNWTNQKNTYIFIINYHLICGKLNDDLIFECVAGAEEERERKRKHKKHDKVIFSYDVVSPYGETTSVLLF